MFKQLVIPSSMILTADGSSEVIDGSQLIPLELGGKLLPPRVIQTVSLTELGKALLKAAEEGETDEVRKLMSKGAPFTADWLGTSPLHFAAQHNHLETCRVLLRAGISRDARTKVERTPLHLAAYEGHNDIVNILLENGADVDAQDMLKMTPLHWAVQNNHTGVVRNLVRNGAGVDIVSKFDVTPLDLALELGRPTLAQILTLEVRNPLSDSDNYITMDIMDNSNDSVSGDQHFVENPPIETVLLEDDNEEDIAAVDNISETESRVNEDDASPEPQTLQFGKELEDGCISFSDPMQLLRHHGITMLPNDDDSTILSSAIDSGHSVVLTEVGKQVLNSTKPASIVPSMQSVQNVNVTNIVKNSQSSRVAIQPRKQTATPQNVKYVTISSDKLLNMSPNILKQIGNALPKGKVLKRIVVNPTPTSSNNAIKTKFLNTIRRVENNHNQNNQNQSSRTQNNESTDLETVMRQLKEARKTAEEYKRQLIIKEAEAARYKYQLELITQQNK